ncbi:MAG: hypothetical protein IJE77_09525 [Thermoguttaceae bacterium]|nr:hypothetical protein [Thermoguttaceae bacterium]MBQ9799297.1 hypothetical protein [Thermoguttaceae bacterium]
MNVKTLLYFPAWILGAVVFLASSLYAAENKTLFDGTQKTFERNFIFNPNFSVEDKNLFGELGACLISRQDYGDFVLEVDFLLEDAVEPIALYFRISDVALDRGEGIYVQDDEARILTDKTPSDLDIKLEEVALEKDKVCSLKIIAKGKKINYYIDNKLVHTKTDSRYIRGAIGLKGGNWKKIRVKELGSQEVSNKKKEADSRTFSTNPVFSNRPEAKPSDFNFWNRDFQGRIDLNMNLNGGKYAFGEGEYLFEPDFSSCGERSVYIYRTNNATDLAIAYGATSLNNLMNFSQYDFSERTREPQVGQMVIIRNKFNHYAVIQIVYVNRSRSFVSYNYYILSDEEVRALN